MKIEATSPDDYVTQIPEERQAAFSKLRQTILDNIPEGFEECMNYGMIGYVVPKTTYPAGYHCNTDLPLPFANLASQKNFIGFYHMGVYAKPELYKWFTEGYAKRCKYKLDMGKSCVRLKKMDDIPYDLIGELMQNISMEEWIDTYETNYKK
ncbi:DUF1801 domain-containing protein [Bacteroidia bacterium]|nr:DUF1801 domain-containing protein [Bacteroidia bacterium]MDB4106890.1 DUF1801 domain-containing protein [Bacteroidia bacterium]MDB9882555.1 DUF1801 domain-containing protein [Bacteroidia bacterium]